MSKVLSARFPDDVAARVAQIAAARGCKSPSVVKAAVESYLDDHGRGLPEPAPEPAKVEAVSVDATRAKAQAVESIEEAHARRQARLAELRAQAAASVRRS